ncbi:cupin domain-containing protein [Egibacter rhizosphaerae]|nr:cupin domain-containing protein [Egibacter rhizosphaerae]
MEEPRSLEECFASFDERWQPRIVTRVNDYDVKIAHVEGEYVEHVHDDTDEYFHVLAGELTLTLPGEGRSVVIAAGEVFTVPRGVSHQPSAAPGTRILMFEPRGTLNDGDLGGGTAGEAVS